MPVQTAIQTRRGTASSWTSTNPTLAAGEIGFETDTGKFKIGTGSTAWASLPYAAIDAGLLAAKGDLVTATANDTPAVLTVGSNGETLVADSSASVGLRYQPVKVVNPVINSCFDIWQRGTSLTGTGRVWTADRWWAYRGDGGAGQTVSRQTSGLVGTQYCARIQRDSGNTSTAYVSIWQDIETNESLRFAGQTITISYYARKGANYSGGNFSVELSTGTGTDQSQWSGFTNGTTVLAVNASAASMSTSTWTRYQASVTLASNVTQLGFKAYYNPTGTAGAADFVEVSGFQIELGSIATALQRAGGTLAGELAACQRYYVRFNADQAYSRFGMGTAQNADRAFIDIVLKTTMRTASLTLDTSAVSTFFAENDSATAASSLTSLSILANGCTTNIGIVEIVKTGAFTSGRAYRFLANNSTSAYLGFSAEL